MGEEKDSKTSAIVKGLFKRIEKDWEGGK